MKPSTVTLGVLFLTLYASIGATGPFLALYLHFRGFSAVEATSLLALLPLVRMLTTPVWGIVADALRAPERVLRITCTGAFLVYLSLFFAQRPSHVAWALCAYTAVRASAGTLLDTIGLQYGQREDIAFGKLRALGTAGYALGTLSVGALLQRSNPGMLVPCAALLLGLTAALTFTAPKSEAVERAPLLPALKALLQRERFRWFLASASLHQLGLAAYDNVFPALFSARAGTLLTSVAIILGTSAEVLFFLSSRRWLARFGQRGLLAIAYSISAVRWLLLAVDAPTPVLVFAQTAHAFTFGAFYTASVPLVDEEAPSAVRASAQAVYATLVWGLATSLSLGVASRLLAWGGASALFFGATVASLLSLVLLYFLPTSERE